MLKGSSKQLKATRFLFSFFFVKITINCRGIFKQVMIKAFGVTTAAGSGFDGFMEALILPGAFRFLYIKAIMLLLHTPTYTWDGHLTNITIIL